MHLRKNLNCGSHATPSDYRGVFIRTKADPYHFSNSLPPTSPLPINPTHPLTHSLTPSNPPPPPPLHHSPPPSPCPRPPLLLLPPVAHKQGPTHTAQTTPLAAVNPSHPTLSATIPPRNGPTSDPLAYAIAISAKACAYAPCGPKMPGLDKERSSTT